ncbi:MAG: O-antigen ligase family protein [Burkholderiales bacterium]
MSAAAAFGFALAAAPFVRGHFGHDTLVFVALFGALLVWLAWGVANSKGNAIFLPAGPAPIIVFLYIGWLALSAILSVALSASAPAAWQNGTFGLAFAAMLCVRDRESAWQGALGATLLIAVVWALVAVWQNFALGQLPVAFFFQSNAWAGFANIALFGALAALLAAEKLSRKRNFLLWSMIVLLAGSLGLSGSRGAFLAALAGCAFLLLAGILASRTRRTLLVTGVVFAAIIAGGQSVTLPALLAEQASQSSTELKRDGDPSAVDPSQTLSRSAPLLSRLAQIFDREATLKHRLVIWQPAIAMIETVSWHGAGPGVFWLLYPKYREPSDTSAGFHVHNDYLEAAVELGLPGLMLLLMIPVAAVFAWRRSARAAAGRSSMESAALTAGVLATFAHSAVDFNLHVLPVTLVLGVWLARLHEIADRARPYRRFAPATGLRGKMALRLGALAVLGAVAFVQARLALAAYHYEQAVSVAAAGKTLEATQALDRSLSISEAREVVHIAYADLYVKALTSRPDLPPESRANAATLGLNLLDRAQKLNPLRSDIAMLTGALHEQNAGHLGRLGLMLAKAQYETALARDPRNLEARLALIRLLDAIGDTEGAYAVAEKGLVPFYPRSRNHVLLLAQAASLRARRGDLAGAEQLANAADRQLVELKQPPVVLEGLHAAHAALFATKNSAGPR